MAGARIVYGGALERLFGVLAPVPADRIVALDDTGTVDLGGGRRLDSHYSPGHAKHHVGLIDSDTGDLYVGDAAGVYMPDTGDVRPATPPPDFDLAAAWPRYASSPRCARPGYCLATTGRSTRSARLWTVRRRRSTSGSRRRGGRARPAWTSTTRSPWSGTAPWTGTQRPDRTPTRPWRRGSSGSAAPAATWKASCSGSTRDRRPPGFYLVGAALAALGFQRSDIAGREGQARQKALTTDHPGRHRSQPDAGRRARRAIIVSEPTAPFPQGPGRAGPLPWRATASVRSEAEVPATGLAFPCVDRLLDDRPSSFSGSRSVVIEIVEFDAVELIEAVGRVGLAIRVGLGGSGECVPGLVGAPGGQQGVRVGVEQPRRPGPQSAAGQLGYLQGQDGGVRQPLVPADAGLDDPQLDPRGAVEVVRWPPAPARAPGPGGRGRARSRP